MATETRSKVIVIFRVFHSGGLVALMPAEPATPDGRYCCCYGWDGHGSADYQVCIDGSRAAGKGEYLTLLQHMRRMGYTLDVRKRAGSEMHDRRREEARRLRGAGRGEARTR